MNSISLKTIPKVTKLTNNIIRVLGCNPGPMTLQGTNTYIIGSGKKRILLDTGAPNIPEYISNLKSVISKNGITLSDIIITHWHHDHIGGVQDILKAYSLECTVWKYPRTDNKDESYTNYQLKYLQNGQEFKVDEDLTLKIIHTPGHTTDHVIALFIEHLAVFSGDCILGEGTAVFEDLYDYMTSLRLILDLQPKIIYPGHGNVIEDPILKLTYYINHRIEREKQILKVLKDYPNQSFSVMDIVKKVYIQTPENLWNAAAVNVTHHLEKLVKDKKVLPIIGKNMYKAKL